MDNIRGDTEYFSATTAPFAMLAAPPVNDDAVRVFNTSSRMADLKIPLRPAWILIHMSRLVRFKLSQVVTTLSIIILATLQRQHHWPRHLHVHLSVQPLETCQRVGLKVGKCHVVAPTMPRTLFVVILSTIIIIIIIEPDFSFHLVG